MIGRKIKHAADLIKEAKYGVAFTGAGISVESGIPPFRGDNGLWNLVNPIYFEIEFFNKKPLQSWLKFKEVFYDKLVVAEPNISHRTLAKFGELGFVKSVITQNIDFLHQKAGFKNVFELHGTYMQLKCTKCSTEYDISFTDLNFLPPTCLICGGILKPDMVFFNEPIPDFVKKNAFMEAERADVFIIIGTNAEVYPANTIPLFAKEHGAKIIEINIEKTNFTSTITDVFLKGKAGIVMKSLLEHINL